MTEQKILKATHGSTKTPLKIGDLEIPCYVLEDKTRVLSQRGVNKALDRPEGGTSEGAGNLPSFIGIKALKPFISKELIARVSEPIVYLPPHGGNPANGIPATVLPEICDVWMRAREAGVLKGKQLETAHKAEILSRGLATVGIIAMVDEATGYQGDRPSDELRKILEAYIAKELLPWSKRFPDNFYEQLFRLNGWQYNPLSVKRPRIAGKMTEDIIYRLLPPGVLEELRKKNPKGSKGHRKHKHHQLLTDEFGVPHLDKLLASVTTLMRISPNWRKFKSLLNRAFPQKGDQLSLIPDDDIED